MRIANTLCALGFLAAAVISAADVIPSLAGYEAVEITKVEPDGVRVTHKNGVAKIRFEVLPEDLRKKYGFSEDKAKEFREKTGKDRADQEKLARVLEMLTQVNVGVHGTVLQVQENGVLLVNILCTFGTKVKVTRTEVTGTRLGTNTAHSESGPLPEFTLKTKWVQPKAFERGPVFVACDTKGLIDQQAFRAIIFPAGTYKYVTVDGAGSSIPMWTVYPDTFTGAEGLEPIPDWAIVQIQDQYKHYPAIPRSMITVAKSASTGTGVVVGDGTLVVTCAHVVGGRKVVTIVSPAGSIECDVLSENSPSDLALLKLRNRTLSAATINTLGAEPGEGVFTLGFPNPDIQGTEAKLTDGKVSSLTGLRDNSQSMQITVPVQPGNSGGPLFNLNGEVVGVITSKLSAAVALGRSGALPENVNYAVKIDALSGLLPAGQMKVRSSSIRSTTVPSLPEVVKKVRNSVVQVIAKAS